ncbi:MAG: transcription termination/antitermination protein NusA [Ruminococcaceae bacterium]|nr:transcription termination/antitermination protein NusA [Oscillospiraceae bacterium]
MNNEFFDALEILEKDKGIPKEYMFEKVEAALLTAYKKDNNGQSNVRINLDPVKRNVRMFIQKTVVEEVLDPQTEIGLEDARLKSKRAKLGDVLEYEFKPKNFGRISAQTAKMVIIQGIREAERGMMIKEYESKKEDIVTATVSMVDPVNGNVVLEMGSNQATLVRSEQLPTDRFEVGDSVKVYVCAVKKETRGPIVILSRTHPGLVKRLFEMEVPEIQDGTVTIHSIAREAGSRTKIAVCSNDPAVDPIGACIGVRGIRKNNITNELAGEKIDIVKYSEDPAEFISAALSPASIVSVTVNEDRTSRVVVDPDQLSLAIGKKGQNACLAAKLTGYKIDIKPTDYVGE